MEFASFEDDLFNDQQSGTEKLLSHPDTYNPKWEFPGWFLEDSGSKDLEKERMRANYYYWRRDYEKAAQLYGYLLKNTTTNLLHLEFTECYARSLMACNRFDDAERSAIDFYNRAINYDQQLQALNLLSDLYWARGDHKRSAVICACLASMMDGGNADIWYRLGHCFLRWNQSDHTNQPNDFIDSSRLLGIGIDFTDSQSWFRKCLIRAHALYWSTYATSVGYGRERNEKLRKQIEADLRSINCKDDFLDFGPIKRMDEKEEADQNGSEDQLSGGKPELDKMLNEDLVCVFESFVKKWLS